MVKSGPLRKPVSNRSLQRFLTVYSPADCVVLNAYATILAMMDEAEVHDIVRAIVSRYLDLKQTYVFLFGSRADGTAQRVSDYDIGLYRGEEIPAHVLGQIRADLSDSNIPVNVDIIDFSTVRPSFKHVSLQHIQIWNQPQNLKLELRP